MSPVLSFIIPVYNVEAYLKNVSTAFLSKAEQTAR